MTVKPVDIAPIVKRAGWGTGVVHTGVAGIYRIRNTVTGESYIGSSLEIRSRLRGHASQLRRGVHPVQAMQESFRLHGESAFAFEQLREVRPTSEDDISDYRRRVVLAENVLIRRERPAWNPTRMSDDWIEMSRQRLGKRRPAPSKGRG